MGFKYVLQKQTFVDSEIKISRTSYITDKISTVRKELVN